MVHRTSHVCNCLPAPRWVSCLPPWTVGPRRARTLSVLCPTAKPAPGSVLAHGGCSLSTCWRVNEETLPGSLQPAEPTSLPLTEDPPEPLLPIRGHTVQLPLSFFPLSREFCWDTARDGQLPSPTLGMAQDGGVSRGPSCSLDGLLSAMAGLEWKLSL